MHQENTLGLFAFSERDLAIDRLHAATAIYTKAEVIDPLLRRSGWPNRDLSLFDPSCGDGAFPVEALRLARFPINNLRAIARVRGWEIHPQAVEEARLNIVSQLVSTGWTKDFAIRAAHQMVVEEDFLNPSCPIEPCTLLAGNPPYLGRVAHGTTNCERQRPRHGRCRWHNSRHVRSFTQWLSVCLWVLEGSLLSAPF